jgi:NTE family protein
MIAITMSGDESTNRRDLALVLGGGGARAAYQAGILRGLARLRPELRFPILTGVSAGAINAAFLASFGGSASEAANALADLWRTLTVEKVFRADPWALARNFFNWGCRLLSCGLRIGAPPRALVDTEPLHRFLSSALGDEGDGIPGIGRNLDRGTLHALALTTIDYGTGQSVVWMQGKDVQPWRRPQRIGAAAEIGVQHVMASAALPILFPAVQVGGGWHGDGGIRLAPPFSPAIKLGASRILAISTRYDRSQSEADRTAVRGYPPPAQILGQLMNSIFLDFYDQDASRIELVNKLVESSEGSSGSELRRVETLVLRPSEDLGRLAARFEPRLPRAFRFLTRGLGTRETESPDALSMIMFQPDFTRRLMELGESDAETRIDPIDELTSP